MSGSLNKVMLIGNLGRDPEIRRTQAGDPIANLRLASSERWTDKASGEKRERTEWHNVVIFNEALGRVAEQYLHKGGKVYLEGALQTRKWQDQSGADRYSTEVVLQNFNGQLVLLDSRGDSENAGGGFSGPRASDSRPSEGRRPSAVPAFQSGGWGRKLIEAELDSLRRVGAPAVFLGVGLTNARAIGFYAHVGFERVEGPANALWLARQL